MIRAMQQAAIDSAEMSLRLSFTADGSVTSVSVAKSSRNRDLDRAAQSWARAEDVPGRGGRRHPARRVQHERLILKGNSVRER